MQKRPRMPFPRPLSGVVQESLVGLGLAERLCEAEIWRIWQDAVGDALARRAQPVRIINGTLTVAVSSAPWMQELRYMTDMMKEKLNTMIGAEVVKEIVLRSGKVVPPVAVVQEAPVICRPLDGQQLAAIELQSQKIEDPETRLAFMELMKASLERRS